ncbi:GTP-binding protein [Oscillatoriales cyanobacterium LEGE 11467]|uniref:GTP-binding protein n=1 Tax=Zarconia navalis LEGE 11467 TaxID=1828826 RepID=A0A928W0F3_9CYAN|nr:Rab family GTPase [Zarconia navalis]MBE9041593.1 GTP-binding protein [Zarconia navalis LEGE 11467]
MATISKKICMVGDFGVGKTSLIRRYVEREFSDRYLSTVGVKISRKTIETINENRQDAVKLQLIIWDLEGHTRFKAIAPSYLQGAAGALVVADVTRVETIENLKERIGLFSSVNPKSSIAVAFNKTDLVVESQLEKIPQYFDVSRFPNVISSYFTSAKTGNNVDEIFEKLAQKLIS